MTHSTQDPIDSSAVDEAWSRLNQVRQEFGDELKDLSNSLPSTGRGRVERLSRWFQGSTDLKSALERPDILATCLPFLKRHRSTEESSKSELASSARIGVCSMTRTAGKNADIFRQLLYPIIMLVASFVLALAFSFYIAPQFESMFNEFGIGLPYMTKAVFRFSHVMQNGWWLMIALALALVVTVYVISYLTRDRRPIGVGWLTFHFRSSRNVLAGWAWHVSLLLEAGVSEVDAVETAGRASGKTWLRNQCAAWSSSCRQQGAITEIFPARNHQMLNRTLLLPESSGKILAIREVATHYWDRNSQVGSWLIECFGSAILFCLAFGFLFVTLSLFMPLLAVVSGLTGTK